MLSAVATVYIKTDTPTKEDPFLAHWVKNPHVNPFCRHSQSVELTIECESRITHATLKALPFPIYRGAVRDCGASFIAVFSQSER